VHRGNVLADAAIPLFFLSYARAPQIDGPDLDDPDVWVAQLFDDLCADVRVLADLPRNANTGFMDRETRVDGDWPSALSRALATCRVFVPLYSLKYFADDRCGREWSCFESRGRKSQAEGIVPAMWRPVDERLLPPAAQAVQPSPGRNEPYATHGFYGIMKLSRYRDAYEEAVFDLARQILKTAERTGRPQGLPAECDRLESAFGAESAKGPWSRVLRITVVAPRRGELPSGRKETSYYGPTAQAWSPYAGFRGRTIADEAVRLAWQHRDRFRAEVGDLCQHEAALLSGRPAPGPQILLIDPWALLLPRYQEVLQRFDAIDSPEVQVMILLNDSDAESKKGYQDEESKLRHTLGTVLGRKLASASLHGADEVWNLEDFRSVFPRLIDAAAYGYRRRAPTFPPVGKAVERPRLIGLTSDVG
jgi:FxsC-like protein